MRTMLLAGVSAMLSGCASLPNQPPVVSEEFEMEVKSVVMPTSASASVPLDIDVEVTAGGCISFRRFETNRTVSRLTLRAIGTHTLNVPCPAYIGWEHHIYTDLGAPARTNPFEIVVNGKSWGTVQIEAAATGGQL